MSAALEVQMVPVADIDVDAVPHELDPAVVAEFETALRTRDLSVVSPRSWFVDCTFLGHDKAEADAMRCRCTRISCARTPLTIPFIDFDVELGWVFHTLFIGGEVYRKPIAERFRKTPSSIACATEHDIELMIVEELEARGEHPRRQVRTSAGIADIVTDRAVYEVKHTLKNDAVFSALGQVLMYRSAINPRLAAVIVGRPAPGTESLRAHLASIGVELWCWEGPR